MRRVTFLLMATVIATGTLLAQAQSSDVGAPNPDDTGVTTPSWPSGPTAPIINLGTTSSNPVGATNATPGNQAGATNSTLQPTDTGGTAPQTVFTTPVIENMPNPTVLASGTANNSQAGGRDLVIGGSDSAWAISSNTMGVAEAARLARAARASHKPRVFTNDDIARLRGTAPVNVVGNTDAPVTNEQTMPASDVQEQEGPTTPVAPQPGVQQPANQTPPAGAPKSPFRTKPSPVQPR